MTTLFIVALMAVAIIAVAALALAISAHRKLAYDRTTRAEARRDAVGHGDWSQVETRADIFEALAPYEKHAPCAKESQRLAEAFRKLDDVSARAEVLVEERFSPGSFTYSRYMFAIASAREQFLANAVASAKAVTSFDRETFDAAKKDAETPLAKEGSDLATVPKLAIAMLFQNRKTSLEQLRDGRVSWKAGGEERVFDSPADLWRGRYTSYRENKVAVDKYRKMSEGIAAAAQPREDNERLLEGLQALVDELSKLSADEARSDTHGVVDDLAELAEGTKAYAEPRLS